ncbi:hypothetical protein TIFTF001_003690 [Ficus carica]|uniref:Uncharacterized protein n=1 Tax=Ficus carica TaxID=3494 RepID=A0AA87ZG08_FICCA|nr:hypothetical protein TIFTF001_003690 [Ficus carica]
MGRNHGWRTLAFESDSALATNSLRRPSMDCAWQILNIKAKFDRPAQSLDSVDLNLDSQRLYLCSS